MATCDFLEMSEDEQTQEWSNNDESEFDMDDLLEDVRAQVVEYLKTEGPKIIQAEIKRQVTALIKSEIGTLKRQGAVIDLTQTESSGSMKPEKSSKSSKLDDVKKKSKK